jgi:hypothetical protein
VIRGLEPGDLPMESSLNVDLARGSAFPLGKADRAPLSPPAYGLLKAEESALWLATTIEAKHLIERGSLSLPLKTNSPTPSAMSKGVDPLTGMSLASRRRSRDDFPANANTSGSVPIGGSTRGVVNFPADRDWFSVSLREGHIYRFNLDGITLSDPTLALRNAKGRELAFNDDFDSLNSQISYIARRSGRYFLDAGAFSTGQGSYTLSASRVTDDFADNANTTGSVPIGGSTRGVVNFPEDRDWFSVSLREGRTYRFNLDGITLSDPTLALRNARGRELAFNDDFNSLNSQISYTAKRSGRYFLDAGSFDNSQGSYRLSASRGGTRTT